MSGPMRVCVLTVSDRCSRGETQDFSGPALVELATQRLSAQVLATACVPDEKPQIAQQLKNWASSELAPDLILTTGGTGLSPRDVTPEATASVLERQHPALLELVRLRCMDKSPRVFLSRGLAGTIGRTLVINFPGSTRGAREGLEALLELLPHAIGVMRGEVKDEGRPHKH